MTMHNIPNILEHRTMEQAIEFIETHFLEKVENYFELLGFAWAQRESYLIVKQFERYLPMLGETFDSEKVTPETNLDFAFATGVLEALDHADEWHGDGKGRKKKLVSAIDDAWTESWGPLDEFLYGLDVSSILSGLGLMKSKEEWERLQRPGRWIRPDGMKNKSKKSKQKEVR